MSNNPTIDGVPLALLKDIEMTWRQASGFSNKANDVIEAGLGQLRALLAAPAPVEPLVVRCSFCDVVNTDGNPWSSSWETVDGNLVYRVIGCKNHKHLVDAVIGAQVPASLDAGRWYSAEDIDRQVRELDVLLNGEAGAADQASLCDIVAQVRMARKKPGTGSLQLMALVPDQVVGRVHRAEDVPDQACVELNSCGRALPDHAPLYSRPADTLLRYVRAPSRKDPKYHEEWPEIEGGPVFDGVTYCNDLFAALKRFNVIVAETMPENEVDE